VPLEGAAVALPEDPPEPTWDDGADRALPDPLGRVPTAPPVDAALPVGPAPEAPVVVVANVDCAAAAVLVPGAIVEAVVPVPRLTTPLRVTLPGVAAVCAEAGNAAAIDNSTA
jgi:hypothetical protein